MFRSLQAGFLHELGALLDDAGLVSAGAVYDELVDAWKALAQAAGDRDHARCVELVADVDALERRGVERMERWLAA
jgi:hypothetical protein